jgi:hypothetical protein
MGLRVGPEFGLLCTEDKIRRIRLNYNLAPLRIFQPGARVGKLVKIAARNGEPVFELCKSIRVSNVRRPKVVETMTLL